MKGLKEILKDWYVFVYVYVLKGNIESQMCSAPLQQRSFNQQESCFRWITKFLFEIILIYLIGPCFPELEIG